MKDWRAWSSGLGLWAVTGLVACAKSSGVTVPSERPSLVDDPAFTSDVVVLADGRACAAETFGLEQTAVSMYVMLDASKSMEELTATGESKWEAVQSALLDFVRQTDDPRLNMGLQFFPQPKPGSQFFCRSHDDCGPDGGPCYLSTCTDTDVVELCVSNADCPGSGNRCVPFGLCELNQEQACVRGTSCGDLGECGDFERECTQAIDCNAAPYARPAVEIGPLTELESSLIVSIAGRRLVGKTPTAPALQGAVTHAGEWAASHQGERVVAVLATDGLPTECQPQEIGAVANIAAQALAGPNAIRTFVIGVSLPGDQAGLQNLNALALAGGSSQAIVLDAGTGSLQQQFLTALQGIRAAAAQCEFRLPQDRSVDFSSVNLSFTAAGVTEQLPYATDLAGCTTTANGWYYNVNPSLATPTTLSVCPSVCDRFKTSGSGSVQLLLGCATVIL